MEFLVTSNQNLCIVERKYGNNIILFLPIKKEIDSITSQEIYDAWLKSDFRFVEADGIGRQGLRSPQIGGVFSALAHLKSTPLEPATIVMPTGTGKTETMLSLTVAGKFKKTLVIVPSDSLREQITEKFVHLGLLRSLGLISQDLPNPNVLKIKQGIRTVEDLYILEQANVVIATATAVSRFSEDILELFTRQCTHLIVDEAHHITAKTWSRIKNKFLKKRPILQFTATPFRADGQRVDGKIIYNYHIETAQNEGYFKEIEFYPVIEYVESKSDYVIAEKSVSLLKKDMFDGFNHILMARANTIDRAKFIFDIYKKYTEFNPVLITCKENKKNSIIEQIKSGHHKIVVCVDMLGEGFDLPELKIAALHDVHKSINITLQFTGRFTRVKSKVGNAKFIANIADPGVNDMLNMLYDQDADWNRVIREIGAKKINDEKLYQDFRQGFDTTTSKLIDQNLMPKVSTVIYKVNSKSIWNPQKFSNIIDKNSELVDFTYNRDRMVLLFSIKSYRSVSWSTCQDIRDISWDLYIVYLNKELGLVFAHSSCKDGKISKLVESIAGKVQKINGEEVFRAMSGFKRLKFQNVGLNKDRKKLRYIMYTGTDTQEAIPLLESSKARKSNLFAKGFESGVASSIGCSHKGKIWAMDSSSVDKWISWCDKIGAKITDTSIDTNQIMKTAMKSQLLKKFSKLAIVGIDWPVELLRRNEGSITWKYNEREYSFLDSEITIEAGVVSGKSTPFSIVVGDEKIFADYKLKTGGGFEISIRERLQIKFGNNEFAANEYLSENPPILYLADTSIIDGDYRHYSDDSNLQPYNKDRVEVWDWTGVDISVESQRKEKLTNSIQYRTIQNIFNKYDVIFDDDGSQEVADIVAIKNIRDENLVIDFYHCKYCKKKDGVAQPGSRVDDVYQVAGQVIKGVKWANNSEKLFERLIIRERKRLKIEEPSRIEKGNLEDLRRLQKVSRVAMTKHTFYIVQPAVSKVLASNELLSVFGAAEAYVMETTGSMLEVIVSN